MGNYAADVGNWRRELPEAGAMSAGAPSESRTAPGAPGAGAVPGAVPGALNPAALAVADAARVLSRAGGFPVSEEMLRADIDAGAPTNIDGTVNLVHYAAWLVREMSGRGD